MALHFQWLYDIIKIVCSETPIGFIRRPKGLHTDLADVRARLGCVK